MRASKERKYCPGCQRQLVERLLVRDERGVVVVRDEDATYYGQKSIFVLICPGCGKVPNDCHCAGSIAMPVKESTLFGYEEK